MKRYRALNTSVLVYPEGSDTYNEVFLTHCSSPGRAEFVAEGLNAAEQLQGAVEALRAIARVPHSGDGDSAACARERGRIAREALHTYGGQSGALPSPSSDLTKEDR